MPLAKVPVRSSSRKSLDSLSPAEPRSSVSARQKKALEPTPGLLEVGRWVFSDDFPLSVAHRACLAALSTFGGPNSRGIFPSVSTLARRYGCCERSARSHLRQLEALGLVTITSQRGPDGRQSSHRYTLHLEAIQRLALASERTESLAASDGSANDSDVTLIGLEALDAELAGASFEPDECLLVAWQAYVARPARPAHAPRLASTNRQGIPGRSEPAASLHGPPRVRHELPLAPERAAAELLHPISSQELLQEGERETSTPVFEESSRKSDNPDAPSVTTRLAAAHDVLLETREVAALWATAWSERYRSVYTPDRQDAARIRWLAELAAHQAHVRAEAMRAAGLPSPDMPSLMRQFLTLLFAAFLAEPGRPTGRGSEGYLAWMRHPLRCLEQDVGRLRVRWPSLPTSALAPTRVASIATPAHPEALHPTATASRDSSTYPADSSSSSQAAPSRSWLSRGRQPLPTVVSSEPAPSHARMPPAEVVARLRALGLFRPEGTAATHHRSEGTAATRPGVASAGRACGVA